jgi:hypothetical protein
MAHADTPKEVRTLPNALYGLSLAAITLANLYVAAGMWGWTYDDAFIIYRYARNFVDGLGMVYNPGEH